MIAARTLYARLERAVNTLKQLLARHRSVMDSIKALWNTLLLANLIFLGVFRSALKLFFVSSVLCFVFC